MKLIPLSQQGKHKGKYFAKVDDKNFEWLNQFKWRIKIKDDLIYAITGVDGKIVRMHIMIMKEKMIDHADNDGLNNQEYNLRKSTYSQNNSNRSSAKNSSSRYLGVTKCGNKFRATICHNKKYYYLGTFNNEIHAATAYDKKALELHGSFANCNFKP